MGRWMSCACCNQARDVGCGCVSWKGVLDDDSFTAPDESHVSAACFGRDLRDVVMQEGDSRVMDAGRSVTAT